MDWLAFLEKARPTSPRPGLLLCIDPGPTTGWAIFHRARLRAFGQRRIQGFDDFDRLIDYAPPDALVVENYRIYAHKLNEHVGSEVVTIQYIGHIKAIAEARGIPLTLQMAVQAKGFVTNRKLRDWGLYQRGQRHANDAIRHGAYFLLFGSKA